FVDCETGQSLDVTNAGELLNLYQAQRQFLEESLHNLCRRRNGRFFSVGTDVPLESVLFDHLCRLGWVIR
ncbi:MAG: DUF58 domain-containing protein, partial [Planctomycetaceae bacterium]|nr:DUF58 domain-containing protein [Planctomycetaceae bacterium]